jgi:hypothetical protein
MTLLEQLEADHIKITAILRAHREDVQASDHAHLTVQTLYQLYMDELEDALAALNSMISNLCIES